MSAGEQVAADDVEAAGERDLDVAFERPAEERLRGGAGDVFRVDDLRCPALARERFPFLLAENDRRAG